MKKTPPQTGHLAPSDVDVSSRLAALAEPIQLRMLRILESQELGVGEVANVVQLPQSTVSRRLKTLADAGWALRRTDGPATLYRLVLDELSRPDRELWLSVRERAAPPETLGQDERRLRTVLSERRTDSLAFFGRVAGEWDDIRSELFGTGFTAPALLALLDPSWVVADLGCGTGNVAEFLAPHVRRVVAVDRSDAMLGAVRKRLGDQPNVEVIRGDLCDLPLKDASVDAATCVLALHHLEEPERAVGEMRRVVRSGGVALVIDMTKHDRAEYKRTMGHARLGFSDDEVRSMFEEAGFRDPRVLPLMGLPQAKGPGLFVATGRCPQERAELQRM